MRFRVTVESGTATDAEVSASPEASVGDVIKALGGRPWDTVTVRGVAVDPTSRLGESSIREGASICVGTPVGSPGAETTAEFALRISSGPEAGRLVPLASGRTVVGRGRAATARVDDPELSREHFAVDVSGEQCTIEDLGSTNGTFIDSPTRLTQRRLIAPGDVISAGLTTFEVATAGSDRAAVTPDGQGGLVLNRSYRIEEPEPTLELEWPTPPTKPERSGIPWIATLAPAVIGVVMAVVLKQPTFLLFALLSPVTMFATQWSSRRQSGAKTGSERAQYEERVDNVTMQIDDALAVQAARRNDDWPGPSDVIGILGVPTKRLWERRPTDPDFLRLRVGRGTWPAAIELRHRSDDSRDELPSLDLQLTPIGVDLSDVGVLGVAGLPSLTEGLGRWFAAQLVALHTPDDVLLVVLAPGAGNERWAWLRWARHSRLIEDQRLLWVATDATTVDSRSRAIKELVEQREQSKQHTSSDVAFSPSVVVILDGAAALRRRPDVAAILQRGPDVGVFFVCLDSKANLLPEECRSVVDGTQVGGDAAATVTFPNGTTLTGVLPDAIDSGALAVAARVPAAIRRVAGASGGSIPSSVRLLDLLDMAEPTAAAIRSRWQNPNRSMAVLVGATDDAPQQIDLATDGPHALIAGMTGSGKSEFIQTLVASLAVANRPDEIQFVFVDYKGGSAFRELAMLPHCGGLVTNLDARLTRRALSSLDADIKRRQRMLSDVGARDHADYQRIRLRRPELAALPRLIIVVDEFAEMKEDLPDFIDGLVAIARVGRSLGVHLLLATQRPSGVVSPEIRSNANLRICLRVASDSDSLDVVEAPDAGRISKENPGRAVMRVGSEPLRTFQSARVGGLSGAVATADDSVTVRRLTWDDWLYASADGGPAAASELTDLDLLVRAISDAAEAEQVTVAQRPWTEPLPALFLLDAAPEHDDWTVTLGIRDVPALQRQEPWDVALDQNLLVIGCARSGRTTLVRSLAAAVARTQSPASAHVYVLDGGNSLPSLAALPHVGAVVPRGQVDRAGRLLNRLSQAVMDRTAQLSERGYSDVREQWAGVEPEERLSRIVLVVDRWESWSEDLANAGHDDLLNRLLSEGPAAGISVVITADESVLRSRIPGRVAHVAMLRVNDPTAGLNIGLPSASASATTTLPPGRSLLVPDGAEVQVGVLSDGSGAAESQAIADIASLFGDVSPHGLPFKVVALPTSVSRESLTVEATPEQLVLGVGGDEAATVVVDLSGGLVIAGPARSGRSTALRTLVLDAATSGLRILAITPRKSELRNVGERVALWQSDRIGAAGWTQDLRDFDLVVIDDFELVSNDLDLAAVLAQPGGPALIVSAELDACSMPNATMRGVLKRAQQQLLLCPPDHLVAQSLGIRLARGGGWSGPPGRGVFSADGEQIMVQVAR